MEAAIDEYLTLEVAHPDNRHYPRIISSLSRILENLNTGESEDE